MAKGAIQGRDQVQVSFSSGGSMVVGVCGKMTEWFLEQL